MWESRRDFQRVWEGWEAGIHGFPYFPYSVISMACFARQCLITVTPPGEMCRTRHGTLVVIDCH